MKLDAAVCGKIEECSASVSDGGRLLLMERGMRCVCIYESRPIADMMEFEPVNGLC
jgi:hypothetical protein